MLWTIGVYVLTFQVEESNAQRRFLAAHKLCLKGTEYDACMERPRDAWNSSAKEDHERAVHITGYNALVAGYWSVRLLAYSDG